MSIEAMKRVVEAFDDLPPDHPARYANLQINALRTAIQQAEAQQPATGEPVVWNSIQIASWIGTQLMHEPSMFERATVCKFVRSLGRHPTLLKHSPKIHPAPGVPDDVVRLVRFMEAAFVPMTRQQDEIAKALALASTALAASPALRGHHQDMS